VPVGFGTGDDCVPPGVALGIGLGDECVPPGAALGIGLGLDFGSRPEEALATQSGFCVAASITLLGFEVAVVADPAPTVAFEFVPVDVRNCDPSSLFCDVVWPAPAETNSAP
jgi:hypothetical protein